MIELLSEKTAVETLARFKDQGLSERRARKALKQSEKHLVKGDLKTIKELQLFSVVSSEGEHFDEIEFLVASRFARAGDVFLSGEKYCVNISKLMREARDALKAW